LAAEDESPRSARSGKRVFLGHRSWLLGFFALMLVVLVSAFVWVIVTSQSDSKRQAEKRFDGEALLSAQLTGTLFTTSVSGTEGAAAKAFGAQTIDARSLAAYVAQAKLRYVVILDQSGKVIAASPGAPARASGSPLPTHVRQALQGHAWFSDILPAGPHGKAGTLEWAIPFTTPFGRRVEIQALDGTPIFQFLSSYLTKTQSAGNGAAFVLDSTNHVVAVAGVVGLKLGGKPKAATLIAALNRRTHGTYGYSGARRYFSSAAVDGSGWRVVLSVRTNTLYPALSGSRGWLLYLIVGGFGVAGLLSLLFFRRALTTGVALERVNHELTTLNVGLEERIAERTAAAEERSKELARSNEELEQFSSVASHDLQEPLRKIRMFGDRLRDRLGDDLSEEAGLDLERMRSAAERMQRLISDLLDFSRVTHRGREFESVDLRSVTEEVIADLEARIVELDATIELGALPTLEADRTQMRQLMQNLVGNALKFHRAGVRPVIRVGADVINGQEPRFAGEARANGRVVITVEDNGIGFDEKHAERIFTAFERLHGRSAYDGTGIGLSIARKIVWRHRGDLVGRGTPDVGATFTVTLPLRQSSSNGRNGGAS
jgi:signal transduction histidine kinase